MILFLQKKVNRCFYASCVIVDGAFIGSMNTQHNKPYEESEYIIIIIIKKY